MCIGVLEIIKLVVTCFVAGELEVRELRRRLMETEAQMSRLLKAMEHVDDNVSTNLTNIAVRCFVYCFV